MKPENPGSKGQGQGRPDTAPGQQKTSTWTRTNPTTGETETRTGSNADWRNRDKSEGWSRPEGDEGTESGEDTGGDSGGGDSGGSTPV